MSAALKVLPGIPVPAQSAQLCESVVRLSLGLAYKWGTFQASMQAPAAGQDIL